ncbi:cytochrome P450 [Daldinia eschscholtzii]|nr:cytochrome P450 [Daldinia eschscholtzii]
MEGGLFGYNASTTSFLSNIFTERLYLPLTSTSLSTSPSGVWIAILALSVPWVIYQAILALFRESQLPANAPPLWKPDHLPFIGAIRFFTGRTDMYLEAVGAHSQKGPRSGNFSFFLGKRHVVGLGVSAEERSNFFENRKMSLMQGTAELLTGLPLTQDIERFSKYFVSSLVTILSREKFVRNLHRLTDDTRKMCLDLLKKDLIRPINDGEGESEKADDKQWRVMNPFDEIYRLIYQMTIRTLAAEEVADDRALGDYTLNVFQSLEHRASIAKVFISWLPAPGHYLRIWDGYRLYRVFARVVKERAHTGTRREDTLQYLIDAGASIKDITGFVINALFGGQVNTGINAAWIPIFLSLSPEWKARAFAEVEGVISRNRTSPEQKPIDILDALTLDSWQNDFPVIDLCLRECIRLILLGCPKRKNTSGADIPVNDRGEVIPNGSYGVYLIDQVHFNPDIYSDPLKFDPGRFEHPRAEDKKVPHAFLGWGAGRHQCLGMRFAKLEITIIMAYFIALFEFELASDVHGTPTTTRPPLPNRNDHFSTKPKQPGYLRYRPRSDMW